MCCLSRTFATSIVVILADGKALDNPEQTNKEFKLVWAGCGSADTKAV